MKFKRILSFILCLIMIVSLAACNNDGGSDEKDEETEKTVSPVGKWYNSTGSCLKIDSDGTWELDDGDESGEWESGKSSKIKFTNSSDETTEISIKKKSGKEYLDFGDFIFDDEDKNVFYRNKYPETTSGGDESGEGDATVVSETTPAETEPEQKIVNVDPFTGIEVVVSGISPYCEIAVNNQKCDSNAQLYVTYTFDKENYANGDTAVIKAEFEGLYYVDGNYYDDHTDNIYQLTTDSMTFEIVNQPEYISSLDGLDLSALYSELADHVAAETSAAPTSGNLFSEWIGTKVSVETPTFMAAHLSSLKMIRYDAFGWNTPFNQLTFVYHTKYTSLWGDEYNLYSCISAQNIVKYPDGSIKWGSESLDDFDFVDESDDVSAESIANQVVFSERDNYNISEVTSVVTAGMSAIS